MQVTTVLEVVLSFDSKSRRSQLAKQKKTLVVVSAKRQMNGLRVRKDMLCVH